VSESITGDLGNEALVAAFVAALGAGGRRPRTVAGYRNDVRSFAEWLAHRPGTPGLVGVGSQDVAAYRHHLQHEQERAACTINRRLSGLRVFYDWALDEGHVTINPALGVRGVSVAPEPVRWLTRTEQMRLIVAIEMDLSWARDAHAEGQPNTGARACGPPYRSLRDRAIVVTLLNTGLRVVELVNLRLGQVTLAEDRGSLQVTAGKGGRDRSIALNAMARQVLAEYLEVRPNVADEAFFIGRRGPMSVRQVPRILKRYVSQAGLDAAEVTVHTLRHTFARNLVEAGVAAADVAALLGFARTGSVSRYMTDPSGDLQPAVDRVGEMTQALLLTDAIEAPY
jgi:integrase/recombinase XerC